MEDTAKYDFPFGKKRNPGDGQASPSERAQFIPPPSPPLDCRSAPIQAREVGLQYLANEIASLIPEMAKDGPWNNAVLIANKIADWMRSAQPAAPERETYVDAQRRDRISEEACAQKLAAVSTVCGDGSIELERDNMFWSPAFEDAQSLRRDYEHLHNAVKFWVDAWFGKGIDHDVFGPMFDQLKTAQRRRFDRQTRGLTAEPGDTK